MTMKEVFNKVEAYNEIAEMMGTDKAQIFFADIDSAYNYSSGEYFMDYNEFRKYIRNEYVKDIADQILKYDAFELDKETVFDWYGDVCTFSPQLTAR